jgi:hypothetical protein
MIRSLTGAFPLPKSRLSSMSFGLDWLESDEVLAPPKRRTAESPDRFFRNFGGGLTATREAAMSE